jgi:hypothetical protein
MRATWPPVASSQPFPDPARNSVEKETTATADVFDEDGISEADLPFLPAEQYNSVWEAILGHL